MGPAASFSSQNSFGLRDAFDNEFGHGILAVKEFSTGNAVHINAFH